MLNTIQKPVVLIIGATGTTGRYLIEEFDRTPGDVHLMVVARKQEQVDEFLSQGRDAVLMDLDDPKTFANALCGVDRLFLLTGYTVAMLTQSKTIIDAARKARVSHIVHLGVFANWDTTDSHFTWHQLIERYIESSGITWTHLHPNAFMELLPQLMQIRDSRFPILWGEGRVGWIASRDIAAVAATVLREGPTKHHAQDYWLSAEVASGHEVATIFSEVLGRPIYCDIKNPDEFKAMIAASPIERWYGAGVAESFEQVVDGRMGYIATVRNDAPYLTGRPSTTLREWIKDNAALLEAKAS